MPIRDAAYTGDADFAPMLALTERLSDPEGPPSDCTPGDLAWWRALDDAPEAPVNARLWWDGGRLAGFAWPGRDAYDIIADTGRADVYAAALAWAATSQQEKLPVAAGTREVLTWALAGDPLREPILLAHGFAPTEDHLDFRARDLRQPVPLPTPPAGFSLRGLRGEAEAPARTEVHRAAFAPSRLTLAMYRRAMSGPLYRLDLDLVAEAPDGSLAAFVLVWFDARNRAGLFEPVGTHPKFVRRGLARALLYEGMRRLIALGATHAHVNSWGHDPASRALYDAAGLATIASVIRWRKRL